MKKKIIWFLLMFTAAVLVTGCHRNRNRSEQAEDGTCVLYYLNIDGYGLVGVEKDIDLPEDPEEGILLILNELGRVSEDDGLKYTEVLDDQVMYDRVSMDEDEKAVINFGSGYNQLSPEREILVRAAIVKSLVQLDGVSQVFFTVDDMPLTNEEGIAVGNMNGDTFVLDQDKSEVYNYTESVSLYLANKKGDGLVEVMTDVEARDNQSLEEAVLTALKEPHGENTRSPIPENLTFNHIHVMQNICYVDLSNDIMTGVHDVEEEIKVYSIVNTLTSLSRITQVQFTIEGEFVQNMNDVSGFDGLMTYDYSLVSESED